MKKVTTKYYCDICKKEITGARDESKYPIIFHTEQTEGRGCQPYISHESVDLCEECRGKVIVLHAWGAQGNNRYEIRYPKMDGVTPC